MSPVLIVTITSPWVLHVKTIPFKTNRQISTSCSSRSEPLVFYSLRTKPMCLKESCVHFVSQVVT